MKKHEHPRKEETTQHEQHPQEPGPTTGGMGSMGAQPDEPSLEEKLGAPPKAPQEQAPPKHAASRGVAGFHREPLSDDPLDATTESTSPAGLQLDPDTEGRVNTGTGDQPGNTGGSRTGTPPEPVDIAAPQAPDNSGSTPTDPDHERSGGMSGGLGEPS